MGYGRPVKRRLQFDLSETAFCRIDKLVKRAGSSSRAELIRSAILLCDHVLTHMREGSHIVIRHADNSEIVLAWKPGL